MFKKALLAAALTVGAATAGHAATVSFLDDTGPFVTPEFTIAASGSGSLNSQSSGIGVSGGAGDNRLAGTETVTLSFDTAVFLEELELFEAGNSTDTVTVASDLSGSRTFDISGPNNSFQSESFSGFRGTEFTISVVSGGQSGDFGIRVAGATASPVPVPPALALMAGAFGALGLVRRKVLKRA